MIYFGDGETDIPSMKLVKEHGGHSIAVYGSEKKLSTAMKLISEDRVNFVCKADYTENGEVYGVKASAVQKILNLKHAWEFIVDPDVIASPCNFYLLSHIARLINEGFYTNGGDIRSVPVSIGGSKYTPPLPNEFAIKEKIDSIINANSNPIDIAIELALYCMKAKIFIDGNKRASIIFANHFMIQNGVGLLVVPEALVPEFKGLLVAYYEGKNESQIKQFLKEQCWRKF